ncbi:MAG: hypothetical protein KC800_09620 [Candidatus Eremiobacteraeota bacterium]|nr:hypothetical protein [Candidatus Eremiobacteraeota bacterium]
MLKLTNQSAGASARVQLAPQSSVSVAKNRNSTSPATGGNDALTLTRTSQDRNPYEGTAPGHAKVKVGSWGSGKNDSLLGILHQQGYSNREIYTKNQEGHTLLDRVQQVNQLRNANLIRQGQELVVPSKEAPAQTPSTEPQPQTTPGTVSAQSGNQKKEPSVSQVRVGKWGRDANGSLYEILHNQGFQRSQILGEDGNGDSLLKKVARANGLQDPNKVREGATLNVPNSLEALEKMNVPELNKPAARTRPEVSRVSELPRLEVKPLELPKPKIELPPLKPIESPRTSTPVVETPRAEGSDQKAATANMGLLLDGVKNGKFTREEFQYLNALSNRYEETRAQFSKEGFDNDELKALGQFETRYGVTYTRLYNSDDIRLSNNTQATEDPRGQLRLRHYEEGGALWDGFKNGTVDSEKALSEMIRQRAEARAQGGN